EPFGVSPVHARRLVLELFYSDGCHPIQRRQQRDRRVDLVLKLECIGKACPLLEALRVVNWVILKSLRQEAATYPQQFQLVKNRGQHLQQVRLATAVTTGADEGRKLIPFVLHCD